MAPKKKISKEEKLLKDRERKKKKYAEIKNNPELYAIQKEKEQRRYMIRKEKGQIRNIKDMTTRAQRDQRRRWKKNSQTYLKRKANQRKLEQVLMENSPPQSDVENFNKENEPDPLLDRNNHGDPLSDNNAHSKKSALRKDDTQSKLRKLRYQTSKNVKKLKNVIRKLQKDKDVWRKRAIANAKKKKENTIEKDVNNMVKEIQTGKIEKVKKKLMFSETMCRGMTEKYKSLSKKGKRPFIADVFDKNKLKECKILSKLPFAIRKEVLPVQDTVLKQKIKSFFQEEENTRVAPGKRDSIKCKTEIEKGERKQKRFLTDTLKNLHEKYCSEHGFVHYSTFCENRQEWVGFPSKERDTCQCKIHKNVDLLIESLKRAKIITEGSATEMLKTICCNPYNLKCVERNCNVCKNKTLNIKEFDNSIKIPYYEWTTERQTYKTSTGVEKTTTITIKKKFEDHPRNIILKLEAVLNTFLLHTRNMVSQFKAIKDLKENLETDEILIHVDFSENYNLKYNSEIQSFHFGGSRGQVSLHTGVIYYRDKRTGDLENKSFCTMSQCLKHDASAIWAHLEPVLELAQNLVQRITKIHFLSDSPSSQYRNRFIFSMITKLHDQVPNLDAVTWNYQEAGHGKGAPDGIGGTVKNAADSHVRFGGDIGTFEDFVNVVRRNINNIDLMIISEEEINRKKFPEKVPAFKGTNKVHQAIWCSLLPYSVALRNLSCFSCRDSYLPCRHGKHLGVLNVGTNETITCLSVPSTNNCIDMDETLRIDSPTLNNNINETMLLNEFDGTFFFEDNLLLPTDTVCNKENEIPSGLQIPLDGSIYTTIQESYVPKLLQSQQINIQDPSGLPTLSVVNGSPSQAHGGPKSSGVKILSNVPFDWQRYSFTVERPKKFNQSEQEEFRKFLTNDDMEKDYNFESKQLRSSAGEISDSKKEVTLQAVDLKYQENDWAIVKYDVKEKSYYYVGQIIELLATAEYRVNFLKKIKGKAIKFDWPIINDEDMLSELHIVQKLEDPRLNRRRQYIFDYLPNLNYK